MAVSRARFLAQIPFRLHCAVLPEPESTKQQPQRQGKSIKALLKEQHKGTKSGLHASDEIAQSCPLFLSVIKGGHGGTVYSARWSPDGRRIITGSEDGDGGGLVRVFACPERLDDPELSTRAWKHELQKKQRGVPGLLGAIAGQRGSRGRQALGHCRPGGWGSSDPYRGPDGRNRPRRHRDGQPCRMHSANRCL